MLSYKKKLSKNNRIEEHIVGHLYKDFKGNSYLFLGKCRGESSYYFKISSRCRYTYLNLSILDKYIENTHSLDELFDKMVDGKFDFSKYLICLDSMKSFLEDMGDLGYSEEDFVQLYSKNFMLNGYIHIIKIDLIENLKDDK